MATLFATRRGVVSRIDLRNGDVARPFAIRMNGIDAGTNVNPNTKMIITQAAIVQQGNYQFLHTLDETIFVYAFGDRIGDLQVSGIAFMKDCNSDTSGIDAAINNYNKNKISARNSPVIVAYGANNPFRAFLTDMNVELADPERMLGQWTYRFKSFAGRG